MKEQRKQHTLRDIYEDYVNTRLKENEGWYKLYSKKESCTNTLYRLTEGIGKPVEVMSYRRFKAIMMAYLDEAIHRIIGDAHIHPEKLRMEGLGAIIIECVERDHTKKRVNFGATRKLNQVNPETGKLVPVFWDDRDWCVIAWDKPNRTPMMIAYEFKPVAKNSATEDQSFEGIMRRMIRENPSLQQRYRYKPLARKRSPDKPKAQWKKERDEERARQMDEELRAELELGQEPDQSPESQEEQ